MYENIDFCKHMKAEIYAHRWKRWRRVRSSSSVYHSLCLGLRSTSYLGLDLHQCNVSHIPFTLLLKFDQLSQHQGLFTFDF